MREIEVESAFVCKLGRPPELRKWVSPTGQQGSRAAEQRAGGAFCGGADPSFFHDPSKIFFWVEFWVAMEIDTKYD